MSCDKKNTNHVHNNMLFSFFFTHIEKLLYTIFLVKYVFGLFQ